MSILPKAAYISPEEYLLGENDRTDGTRYEYVNGGRCEVFQADMKVGIRTLREDHFYYPDVQVTCEDETDKYYNSSPCLIVKVLSKSTTRTDRTEKLTAYTLLPCSFFGILL